MMLIHVINLDRQNDRLQTFLRLNSRNGLQANRFPAIDGHRLDVPKLIGRP
jgi:GR25 family glycosyltransferase involved in LPS biosynthesis